MVCNFVEQTFENAKMMFTRPDFAPVIFEILENDTYAFYQNMYIRALRVYILPVHAYRLRFSSECWQQLLQVCVNLYSHQTTSKDKSNLMKTMQSIVEYGCLESHLILILKNFLPVLGKKMGFNYIRRDQFLLLKLKNWKSHSLVPYIFHIWCWPYSIFFITIELIFIIKFLLLLQSYL